MDADSRLVGDETALTDPQILTDPYVVLIRKFDTDVIPVSSQAMLCLPQATFIMVSSTLRGNMYATDSANISSPTFPMTTQKCRLGRNTVLQAAFNADRKSRSQATLILTIMMKLQHWKLALHPFSQGARNCHVSQIYMPY